MNLLMAPIEIANLEPTTGKPKREDPALGHTDGRSPGNVA